MRRAFRIVSKGCHMPLTPTRRQKVISIVILFFMIALSLGVILLPFDTENLSVLGYGGLFIITLLGAMSLFVPGPTMIAAVMIGATLNPLLVGLFAGAGSSIGESTGYAAGYATRAVVQGPDQNKAWYWRMLSWMSRFPFLTLFVFSLIPNPVSDVSGLIAGRIGYPYWRFLLSNFFGKAIRFGLTAYLGSIFGIHLKLD
jgi:membrane protein YqaA with SNARE-associated domain